MQVFMCPHVYLCAHLWACQRPITEAQVSAWLSKYLGPAGIRGRVRCSREVRSTQETYWSREYTYWRTRGPVLVLGGVVPAELFMLRGQKTQSSIFPISRGKRWCVAQTASFHTGIAWFDAPGIGASIHVYLLEDDTCWSVLELQ